MYKLYESFQLQDGVEFSKLKPCTIGGTLLVDNDINSALRSPECPQFPHHNFTPDVEKEESKLDSLLCYLLET